jgi:hypothetical protein
MNSWIQGLDRRSGVGDRRDRPLHAHPFRLPATMSFEPLEARQMMAADLQLRAEAVQLFEGHTIGDTVLVPITIANNGQEPFSGRARLSTDVEVRDDQNNVIRSFSLTSDSANLTLEPDAQRTLNISVLLTGSFVPGRYTFSATTLTPLTTAGQVLADENPCDNEVAGLFRNDQFRWRFGNFDNRIGVQINLVDIDGTAFSVSMVGLGYGEITDVTSASGTGRVQEMDVTAYTTSALPIGLYLTRAQSGPAGNGFINFAGDILVEADESSGDDPLVGELSAPDLHLSGTIILPSQTNFALGDRLTIGGLASQLQDVLTAAGLPAGFISNIVNRPNQLLGTLRDGNNLLSRAFRLFGLPDLTFNTVQAVLRQLDVPLVTAVDIGYVAGTLQIDGNASRVTLRGAPPIPVTVNIEGDLGTFSAQAFSGSVAIDGDLARLALNGVTLASEITVGGLLSSARVDNGVQTSIQAAGIASLTTGSLQGCTIGVDADATGPAAKAALTFQGGALTDTTFNFADRRIARFVANSVADSFIDAASVGTLATAKPTAAQPTIGNFSAQVRVAGQSNLRYQIDRLSIGGHYTNSSVYVRGSINSVFVGRFDTAMANPGIIATSTIESFTSPGFVSGMVWANTVGSFSAKVITNNASLELAAGARNIPDPNDPDACQIFFGGLIKSASIVIAPGVTGANVRVVAGADVFDAGTLGFPLARDFGGRLNFAGTPTEDLTTVGGVAVGRIAFIRVTGNTAANSVAFAAATFQSTPLVYGDQTVTIPSVTGSTTAGDLFSGTPALSGRFYRLARTV